YPLRLRQKRRLTGFYPQRNRGGPTAVDHSLSRKEQIMKKLSLALTFTFSVFVFSSLQMRQARADWPVIDYSVLAQTVKELQELKKHYDMLQKQYDELMATKNAVTGSYGMSLLENGPLAALGRREMPATWQEVVALQKSGVIPGVFAEKGEY